MTPIQYVQLGTTVIMLITIVLNLISMYRWRKARKQLEEARQSYQESQTHLEKLIEDSTRINAAITALHELETAPPSTMTAEELDAKIEQVRALAERGPVLDGEVPFPAMFPFDQEGDDEDDEIPGLDDFDTH